MDEAEAIILKGTRKGHGNTFRCEQEVPKSTSKVFGHNPM